MLILRKNLNACILLKPLHYQFKFKVKKSLYRNNIIFIKKKNQQNKIHEGLLILEHK